MSDEWEPSWPDACRRCRRRAAREPKPAVHDGVLYTRWKYPRCGHEWEEAAPTELGDLRVFRAYDDGQTTVGFVDRVDGDNISIAGRVVQRWQIVEY